MIMTDETTRIILCGDEEDFESFEAASIMFSTWITEDSITVEKLKAYNDTH